MTGSGQGSRCVSSGFAHRNMVPREQMELVIRGSVVLRGLRGTPPPALLLAVPGQASPSTSCHVRRKPLGLQTPVVAQRKFSRYLRLWYICRRIARPAKTAANFPLFTPTAYIGLTSGFIVTDICLTISTLLSLARVCHICFVDTRRRPAYLPLKPVLE